MTHQLNKIEMNIDGVGLTVFDLQQSTTAYGTKHAILSNRFKFDEFKVGDGKNYVEVGSHNGLLGFYVARLFPQSHIHLFECNPLMIKAINLGIIVNNLNNVTVYPFGLSDANCEKEFGINLTNTGGSSLLIHGDHQAKIIVRLFDFETILSGFKDIDYLKIDIEGAEFPVFNSLIENKSTLLNRVSLINLELHDAIYPNLNLDRSAVKEYLKSFENLKTIYQD